MKLFKSKTPPLRSVLFVCTANVTRSPSAEMMFRHAISQSGEEWTVASAGVNTVKGAAANPVVSFIMQQRGLPITQHRSQSVDRKLLQRYYWIIVMEKAHRDAILEIDPELKDRVVVMREFGRDNPSDSSDMPDPTGKEIADFAELFDLLNAEIPRIVKVLQNRVSDFSWEGNN